MGKRYLIDTNVIIDFCGGKLTSGARLLLADVIPELSIITNMELFASKNIPQSEYSLLEQFVSIAIVHPVGTDLVKNTVAIRQQYRLKLPDAIIAATAIQYRLVLLTRNVADFTKVKELQIINPYDL